MLSDIITGQVSSSSMTGDSMTGGDIRQVTRDIMVNDSTSVKACQAIQENSNDIRDRYEYQKTMQSQETNYN